MRIMLLGDTHGNRGFVKSAISMCTALAVDQIIQLGDFRILAEDQPRPDLLARRGQGRMGGRHPVVVHRR
jgi:predicted phosphodiesterase